MKTKWLLAVMALYGIVGDEKLGHPSGHAGDHKGPHPSLHHSRPYGDLHPSV